MSGEGRKQGLENKGDILEIQFEKSNWGKHVLLEGTFDDHLILLGKAALSSF
jgi:hypothetical protein